MKNQQLRRPLVVIVAFIAVAFLFTRPVNAFQIRAKHLNITPKTAKDDRIVFQGDPSLCSIWTQDGRLSKSSKRILVLLQGLGTKANSVEDHLANWNQFLDKVAPIFGGVLFFSYQRSTAFPYAEEDTRGDIWEDHIRLLRDRLDGCLARDNTIEAFTLVGHSMGGVIVTEYLQRYGFTPSETAALRVSHVMTLDSPVNGLRRAYCVNTSQVVGVNEDCFVDIFNPIFVALLQRNVNGTKAGKGLGMMWAGRDNWQQLNLNLMNKLACRSALLNDGSARNTAYKNFTNSNDGIFMNGAAEYAVDNGKGSFSKSYSLGAGTIAGLNFSDLSGHHRIYRALSQYPQVGRDIAAFLSSQAKCAQATQPASPSMGNQSGFVTDFEKFGTWKVGNQPWGTFTQSPEQFRSGKFSGKFEYSLPATSDNFFVYRMTSPMSLGKAAQGLQLWVYGNGTPTYLNAWVRDAENRIWQFTFGQTTHTGWQQMNAPFDITRGWPNVIVGGDAKQKLTSPLSLYGFSVDVPDDQSITNFFYIDDLSVSSTPLSAGAANMPALPQPTTVPAVQLPLPGAQSAIAFQSDRTSINAGECINLKWDVTEINGVWLNDSGVAGQGGQQVCPAQTQIFTLKIQKRDNSFEERSITIQVSGAAPPPASNPQPAPQPAPADSGYGTLGVVAADTRRPPEGNPDLNLSLLGYQPNGVAATYKDYGSPDDPLAPQFRGLFADRRQPGFTTAFINNGWDWASNARTPPSPGQYEATVVGVAVSPGESLFAPGSGRTIGNDYAALVLYADSNQITLKYTPEDSIARGYTVFIEGINVNPQLLALYQSTNGAGRSSLPALRAGQLIGVASSGEIRLAIRDNATFMDPRSLQDWWR